MAKRDKIVKRLEELIQTGQRVLATQRAPGQGVISDDYVDSSMFYEWKAGALSFLTYVFNEKSTHYRLFQKGCEHPYKGDTVQGLGVLNAAKQDVEGGLLVKLEDLVAADLFADFLEMAEYLLDAGYKDPAAVLIGGVLEEHLRRLCNSNSIDVNDAGKPKRADKLNADLAKASVYNKLDHKAVTSWLDLRNKAAHAEYDTYNAEQVRLMLAGVREFLVRTVE